MKNNQDKEFKRWLKNKLSVTQALMIHFLITGSLSMFGLAAMSLSSNVAYGAVNIGSTTGTTISKDNAEGGGISIGNNAKADNDYDISIGIDAGRNSSGGSRSITIGSNSRVGDTGYAVNQSIAIGGGVNSTQGAWAKGDQSVSIGGNTRSDGHSSIAIGGDDLNLVASQQISYVNAEDTRTSGNIRDAMKNLTGVDILSPEYSNTMSGHGAVALGVKAVAGHLSLAIGTAATAGAIGTNENIEYKAVNTVAIGSGATAMLDNAIAIGGGAKADDSNPGKKQIGATIKSIQYTWSGGDKIAAGDIVSFGAAGFERQLKNVAPGAVSDKSTDAINGSQLFGIAKNITSENHLKFLGDDGQNDATKVINLSLEKNRLNIVGGAKTDNLSDENIGVVYENGNNKGADGKDLDTENPDYQEGKLKIKLAKELKNLKSAEFKTDTGDKTVINGNGVTITPVTAGKEQVSLTKDGLNNGGNLITNIASNLDGAKTGTTVPTTKADAPINVDDIKNNAATVGDVLQSGWNLQANGAEKDFVKPYDTVNFANGNGTTVVVETKGNKVSTIKYNVNTGDIESVTTGDDSGTVKVKEGDKGKIATVDSVVNAVNSAAFTLKASATTGGTRNGSSSVGENGEDIKAGKTIEMIAGKNLNVTHNNNGKITFATVDTPSFSTVQLGGSKGPKFSKTADGDIKVSDKDDTEPVKITNVKNGSISEESKDAINGSQFHELATNKIKLAGQNGNKASGETNAQNLNQENGIKFTVKSSDGELLEVTASGDTITLTPKTATITTDTDGVPTATTTNGKLVTADDLITTLKGMGWKAVAGKDGTGLVTGNTETLVKSGETVTFKAGDNLKIKQDGKNFIYSLNTALTSLTSAEFKDANNNKVNITPTGIIITKPENTDNNEPEKTVTLNQDGLNNGGNLITNIASNLDGAKTGTTVPTTKADAPINVDDIKNNAATVGDVLQSGWNLQGNGEEKDFVKPYDTVNFANGDGTTATVETTNNKVSTVKYSVNLGDGLKKDDTGNNTISIKPADKSLEVNKAGLKVKTDDTTITTDDNKGLKVVTGTIESVTTGNDSGTVKVKEGDTGKIATVDSVVNAVNSAAFTLKASATTGGTRNGSSSVGENGEDIKAGKTIEMIAGKNLNVTHNENGKIIFATVDTPTFSTVQVGGDQGPKFSKTSDGDIKVSDKDGTNPVKVTNVKDGAVTDTSTDAINGSQFHKVANNTIKLAGQNGDDATTATQTKEQNLNKQGGIKFTIKSSDGKLLEVKAADDTITLTPKTATITTGEDGIPTANIDSGKLVTAEDLVTALKNMGWKAIAGQEGSGTVAAGNAEQLIKAGETVTFKAGNNLAVKQAGKEFIYSLKQELTDLTKVEVKDTAGNSVVTTPTGTTITAKDATDPTKDITTVINAGGTTVTDKDGNTTKVDGNGLTITPKDTTKKPVSVTKDGINAGDKAITNVASNLTNYNSGNKNGLVDLSNTTTTPNSNVATVGDLRNMGWVVSSDKTTGALGTAYNDKVKNADEVKFVGTGAATVSGKTGADGVRTITVDVTVPDVEKGTINAATTEADKGKVVAKTGDENKLTTVDTVVKAINSAAWKATSGTEGTGAAATGHTESVEEIKAGDTVTFKAGDNLIIKQSGKEFAYSLNPELTDLSKVEVKDKAGNSVVTTPTGTTITAKDATDPTKDITTVINAGGTTVTDKDGNTTKVDGNGITITPKNDPANPANDKNPVKLTKDGLNNGGNAITNVAGNLEGAKKDTTLPKTSSTGPSTTDLPNIVNNAATVGDVLNAGWNLQNNGTAKDFVKPYDTVNFVDGLNTKAIVTTDADGKVSNVQIDVKDLPIAYTNESGDKVVKAADGKYYKESDLAGKVFDPTTNTFKNANGTAATQPTEVAKDSVKTNLVNPNAATDKTGTTNPSTLGNVKSGLDTIKDATGGTTPSTTAKTAGLVNLDEKDPATNKLKVSDNNVATVGDLRNMGWVVSSDKTTDGTGEYSAQVKNANEVRFVGKGTATVSGKTVDGVRTITVDVNDQVSTNNSVTPVVYTKADGTQVYPIKQADGTTKFFEKPDGTGAEIPKTDVITSVNGPDGTKKPTTLKNIAGNLEGAKKDTTSPKTSSTGPSTTDLPNIVNNAATVGDVLNAGWNLQNNGTAKDFVKPYDTVNFVDGLNTKAIVTTDKDGTTSNVTYNVTGLPITYTNEAGKPVSKVGDNYYVVNEKGQPLQNDGTPVTKYDANGNPLNDDGTPVTKVDTATKPLSTNLVNPNATTDKQTTEPTTLKNVKGNLPQVNDKDKTVFDPKTGTTKPADDKNTTKAPITAADAADIVKNAGNNAATVGDVLNAGWNLQGNGDAKDFVKPYDTVNFINGGNTTAVVTTAKDGTTSNVTYNVTGLPITYTNEAGKPVSKVGDNYYVVNEKGQPLQNDGTPVTKYDANGNPLNDDGTPVTKVDTATKPLSTNLVNPNAATDKQTTTPTQLGNVANGAKTFEPAKDVNGNDLKLGNDGKWYPADKVEANGTPKADAVPVTTPINPGKAGLVDFSKSNPTNAATVGDLQNMGWVVSSDKTTGDLGKAYNDQVRNANEVKFVGKNGIQVSGKTDDKGVRTLTFEMEAGEVTPTEITKADGTNKTKLVKVGDKVYNPEDIGTDGKPKQGKNPVGTIAKDGKVYNSGDVVNGVPNNGANPIDGITVTPNNGSKFVTGNQVADAIEKSGFVVGKNNKALSAADFKNEDEKVNPNDELRFADGDNTNVKLATKEVIDASGKVKTVTTVKVDVVDLPVKYTDADGNIVKKGEDGKYYNPKDLDEKVYDPATKTYKNADGSALAEQPTPKAKDSIVSSLVNPNDAKDGKVGTPSTLTNVANGAKTFDPAKDADGNDLKLGNDGKWYPADKIEAKGTPKADAVPVATPVNPGKAGLVDFNNSTPTNVATVGDLRNMGWVVSTSDTGYNDQVRNTNKVDFKQGTGIKISGQTTADGTRQITIGLDTGKVTNEVTITKPNGEKVNAIKVTQPDGTVKYYEKDKDGKADLKKEVPVGTGANDNKVTADDGSRVVTGNAVATAIGESGWNVGKANTKDVTKAFETNAKLHDKVNPNDDVKFVDGDNTTVSMVTIDSQNDDGTKKATTYIKTDINKDIHIDSVTTGGKNADGTPGKDGALTVKDKNGNDRVKVVPNGMTITPNKADGTPDPDKAVSLTDKGLNNGGNNITNVKSNLPQVNDSAKKAYDVNGNPIANKNNTAAPITAADAADIMKKAGNNAATVGDVLNAGWNLQENGSDRDFVKPYDTVNFVDGTNTKVTVKTNEDGTKSNVQVNIVGLPIAFADKDGNRVVQGVKDNKIVYYKMLSDGTASKEIVDPKNVQVTNVNPTDAKINTVGTPGATINNVAPAEVSPTSTQAVNGSQLYQVAQEINNVNNKVDKLGERVNKGLAGAAAMSGIEFMEIGINQATVAAAVGGYRGTHAVAVGVQAAPTENTRVNAKMSLTPGSRTEAMYSVGAAYRFNLK